MREIKLNRICKVCMYVVGLRSAPDLNESWAQAEALLRAMRVCRRRRHSPLLCCPQSASRLGIALFHNKSMFSIHQTAALPTSALNATGERDFIHLFWSLDRYFFYAAICGIDCFSAYHFLQGVICYVWRGFSPSGTPRVRVLKDNQK